MTTLDTPSIHDMPAALLPREPTLSEAADEMSDRAAWLAKRCRNQQFALMLTDRDLVALRALAVELECWSDVARRGSGAAVSRRPLPWWRRIRWSGVR